jgi:GST-like protein
MPSFLVKSPLCHSQIRKAFLMIDFFTWTTPNGRKVSIMLEELGADYTVHPVNIGQGEQHEDAFLAISPNNKIPAIYDHETNIAMMETGAILIYLAERHRKFLPNAGKARADVLQWLMWQMGGQGPMLGQVHHFSHFNQGASDYAEERFGNEAKRLYGVLNKQLADSEFIAGDYSIADMACWPWVSRYEWQQIDLAAFPNVQRWYKNILSREAVQQGYHIPKVMPEIPSGD